MYLGDANHATNWYVIKNLRITHIANITDCVENAFDNDEHDISYLQIEAEDVKGESIIDYFPQFYWFLEDAYNSNLRLDYDVPDQVVSLKQHTFNFKTKTEKSEYTKEAEEKYDVIANTTLRKVTMNKVLVHCQMGRSRSATMVAMYIYYKQMVDNPNKPEGITIETVLDYIKRTRHVCDPNIGFLKQLTEFQDLVESGEIQKRVKAFNYDRENSNKNDSNKEIKEESNEDEQGSINDETN